MKKLVLVAFLFVGLLSSTATAQNLVVESVDDTVEVNSTVWGDYAGYAVIKNISNTETINVYCKRQFFSNNWCAFDSAYFCWDLCYPAQFGQSVGGIELKPGRDTNSFSGHVYSPTSGANCIDSVRYTFYNGSNVSDSVSIVIKYKASATFQVEEQPLSIKNIYPNPANNVLIVELGEKNHDGYSIEVYNLLGAKVRSTAINSNRVQLNVADLHAGIYLCTVSKNGTAVETRKIVVKH